MRDAVERQHRLVQSPPATRRRSPRGWNVATRQETGDVIGVAWKQLMIVPVGIYRATGNASMNSRRPPGRSRLPGRPGARFIEQRSTGSVGGSLVRSSRRIRERMADGAARSADGSCLAHAGAPGTHSQIGGIGSEVVGTSDQDRTHRGVGEAAAVESSACPAHCGEWAGRTGSGQPISLSVGSAVAIFQ